MTEQYHVYLTGRSIRCRQLSGLPWRRTLVELPERAWQARDLASLEFPFSKVRKRRRPSLAIYLGSALCKFMVVEVPESVTDSQEQRLVAQASMCRQLGLEANEWNCTVDLQEKNARAVVCAVRCELIARLRILAEAHGVKLVSLTPYASVLWNVLDQQQGDTPTVNHGLLAVEDDAFTVFLAQSGAMVSVNSLMHQGESDLVERELRRIGLSSGVDARAGTRLALAGAFAQAALFASSQMLTTGTPEKYPGKDFRDLLMCTEAAE